MSWPDPDRTVGVNHRLLIEYQRTCWSLVRDLVLPAYATRSSLWSTISQPFTRAGVVQA